MSSKKKITLEVPSEEVDGIVSAMDSAESSFDGKVTEPTVEDVGDDTTPIEPPTDLPVKDQTPTEDELSPPPEQPSTDNVVAPGVDTSNPTHTPEPIKDPSDPLATDTNTINKGKSSVGVSDGTSPVCHADAIAETQAVDAPASTQQVTFDSNGVPVPTTVEVLPHAPSAADYENSPTSPLLTNTLITPQGPGTPPTPMINDANSQVTATTSTPSSEAQPVDQGQTPVNPTDPTHDAHTYYVYNEEGMFQKAFTQEEFKGEAYKFAKDFADQTSGFYVTE